MTFDKFILWFTVIAPIAYSAGPNNLMCASIGARYSFKKSLPFILGVNSNIFLYSLLTGFGLGKILESYPDIYIYIKYAGSAYILYLAYRFFRSSGIKKTEDGDTQTPGFWSGFLLNTLNPKAFTALLIMYSQFLDDHYNVYPQIFLLTIMVLIISVSSHLIWSSGGYWILGRLTTPKAIKIQGMLFGSMLVIVAVWLLFN
jgi:threonine/homoserine/homoserine lactone efflux protein